MTDNFWVKRKVLVTGGTGFLGFFIMEKLSEKGVDEKDIRVPRMLN